MLAMDGLMPTRVSAAESPVINPMAVKAPHFAAKAKHVIFLFMYGGPSHIDTFDYKPSMKGMDNKTVQVKTFGRGGRRNEGRIVEPRWDFHQYGECGKWVSDLFPHVATCVDDIAFLHSMTADSPIHGSAMLMMNSGRVLSGNPSMGSWVTYGLGSESENLPGYVVMLDPTGGPISGAKNWSSGFMPATYQGTVLRGKGAPLVDLIAPKGLEMSRPVQRELLDSLKRTNERHQDSRHDNSDLAARIHSYELAYRMQDSAPESVDLSAETQETLDLYGVGDGRKTDDFGRRCLIARRLVERGVRFVQLYSGGAHNDANWDAHGDLKKNHDKHAGHTDQPIAALLKDLKRSGMLEEDARHLGWRVRTAAHRRSTPTGPAAITTAPGSRCGWPAVESRAASASVPLTSSAPAAVEQPLHVRRLHATVLHQLGFDPNQLAYFFGGLDQRLVGVEHVEPIHEITG